MKKLFNSTDMSTIAKLKRTFAPRYDYYIITKDGVGIKTKSGFSTIRKEKKLK